jgi:hypothetical protein
MQRQERMCDTQTRDYGMMGDGDFGFRWWPMGVAVCP